MPWPDADGSISFEPDLKHYYFDSGDAAMMDKIDQRLRDADANGRPATEAATKPAPNAVDFQGLLAELPEGGEKELETELKAAWASGTGQKKRAENEAPADQPVPQRARAAQDAVEVQTREKQMEMEFS